VSGPGKPYVMGTKCLHKDGYVPFWGHFLVPVRKTVIWKCKYAESFL